MGIGVIPAIVAVVMMAPPGTSARSGLVSS